MGRVVQAVPIPVRVGVSSPNGCGEPVDGLGEPSRPSRLLRVSFSTFTLCSLSLLEAGAGRLVNGETSRSRPWSRAAVFRLPLLSDWSTAAPECAVADVESADVRDAIHRHQRRTEGGWAGSQKNSFSFSSDNAERAAAGEGQTCARDGLHHVGNGRRPHPISNTACAFLGQRACDLRIGTTETLLGEPASCAGDTAANADTWIASVARKAVLMSARAQTFADDPDSIALARRWTVDVLRSAGCGTERTSTSACGCTNAVCGSGRVVRRRVRARHVAARDTASRRCPHRLRCRRPRRVGRRPAAQPPSRARGAYCTAERVGRSGDHHQPPTRTLGAIRHADPC